MQIQVTTSETCIFCLEENEAEPTVYIETLGKDCNCNPFVHKTCIHQWYVNSGYKCPICLRYYNTYVVIPLDIPYYERFKICITWTLIYVLWFVLFLIFILIVTRSWYVK